MSSNPISSKLSTCNQEIKTVMAVGFTGNSRLLQNVLSKPESTSLISMLIWRMTGHRPQSLKIGASMSYQCAKDIGLQGCLRYISRTVQSSPLDAQTPSSPEPFLKLLPIEVNFSYDDQGCAPMPAINAAQACEILHNLVQMTSISEIDITGFGFIGDLSVPDEVPQIERLSRIFVNNIREGIPDIDDVASVLTGSAGLVVEMETGNKLFISVAFIAEDAVREALVYLIARAFHPEPELLKVSTFGLSLPSAAVFH